MSGQILEFYLAGLGAGAALAAIPLFLIRLFSAIKEVDNIG